MNKDIEQILGSLRARVQSEPLSKVEEIRDVDLAGCVGLVLYFGAKALCVLAEGSDDTIRVQSEIPGPTPDTTLVEVSQNPIWGDLIGNKIQAAWLLTNTQQYADGIQLDFSADGREVQAQFVVAASMMKCRVWR